MKYVDQAETIRGEYPDYLRDESRVTAETAHALAWPESESEVLAALARARAHGWPVTVSAARTGIVAAAVPMCGGMILSISGMASLTDFGFDSAANEWYLVGQPGVLISTIDEALASFFAKQGSALSPQARSLATDVQRKGTRLMYPPDPTEMTATLGGTVATNASGARTFKYGATREWIRRIRVALADGTVLDIRRGRVTADSSGSLRIPAALCVVGAVRDSMVPVPTYTMPSTKHCAGYYAAPGMDLIDLFIGSEGTLGVITEIEVRLLERHKDRLSITAFFSSETDAFSFVASMRGLNSTGALDVEAIEYFDATALSLLRQRRADGDTAMPVVPDAGAAIYLELAVTADDMDEALAQLDARLAACGSSTDTAWAGTEEAEIQKMKLLRHAVPETINQTIGERKRRMPSLHKISTDLAVPDEQLETMMQFYHRSLDHAGLQYAVFGHIGNNHLHVNIMPRTEAELALAKTIYAAFADKAIELGGTVAAEHGIGRLKKPFLRLLFGDAGIEQMRKVKQSLDPGNVLGRGVVFDSP